MQIIDEAQYIKNHGTQVAKAVKEIRSEFRLALTGTPVENRLSELWSIFDFLMPGFLYSYEKFRKEIELPAVQYSNSDAMERLQKMILRWWGCGRLRPRMLRLSASSRGTGVVTVPIIRMNIRIRTGCSTWRREKSLMVGIQLI